VVSEPTKNILRWMLHRNMVGGKHTPEGRIFQRMKNAPPVEQKQVMDDWEYCIKQLQWG